MTFLSGINCFFLTANQQNSVRHLSEPYNTFIRERQIKSFRKILAGILHETVRNLPTNRLELCYAKLKQFLISDH